MTEVSNTRTDDVASRTEGRIDPDDSDRIDRAGRTTDGDPIDEDDRSADGSRIDETAPISLEFMIRSSVPIAGTPTEALDALSHLRARGRIDDFEVIRWPEKVILDEPTGRSDVIERFESFERWANEHGLSVRPAFERRTVRSLLGGRRTELRTPVMCLAVYADGDLAGVYPCSDGERRWSAHGFLQRCRDGEGVPLVRVADGTLPDPSA